MSTAMPDNQVKLLCLGLKDNESAEKVRRKVLKRLKLLEKRHLPVGSGGAIRTLSDLDSSDVCSVATNSRYLVFLMKDGRVCRVRCCSQAKAPIESSEELLKKPRETSFQVLSDAVYARQLQAEFDVERIVPRVRSGGGPGRLVGALRPEELSPYIPPYDPSPVVIPDAALSPTLSPPSPVYSPSSPFYTPAQTSEVGISPPVSPNNVQSNWPAEASVHPSAESTAAQASDEPASVSTVSSQNEGQSGTRSGAGLRLGVSFNLLQSGSGLPGLLDKNKDVKTKEKEGIWPEIGELEWLVVKQNPDAGVTETKFCDVAALHSEILLVGAARGQLYSWPCDEGVVNARLHPLTNELGLNKEKIAVMATTEIRASIVTVSGMVMTFYDSLLRGCSEKGTPPLISSLSHSALHFPEFSTDCVKSLSVSDFVAVATTSSGRVYWWGLCPQAKSSHFSASTGAPTASSTTHNAITDGCLVRLKNGPPCGPNALVLHCSRFHGPRVGKTVNIIEHSALDPATSVLVKVLRQDMTLTREEGSDKLESLNCVDSHKVYEGLEVWKQSDVVFLDDSPAILGRVVAVDNNQAVIDISYAQNMDSLSVLNPQSTLKVFRVSELEPCVGIDLNSSLSTTPNSSSTKLTNVASSTGGSSTGNGGPLARSLSRHVAGVIQHHPICLLDPTLSHAYHGESADPAYRGPLSGFFPLAVHCTNEGVYLLLKRVTDGKAFVLCSSHCTSALLQTSSFVALSTRDQKPSKCTTEEEACDSLECGLEVRKDCGGNKGAESKPLPSNTAGKGKAAVGKKRKRKLAQRSAESREECRSNPLFDAANLANFIGLNGSEVLMLQDVHGIPIAISAGLGLKPVRLKQQPLDSEGQSKPITLTQPFTSLLSRHHFTARGSKKTLLIVAVPKQTYLVPALVDGDVERVRKALLRISHSIAPSSYAEHLSKKSRVDPSSDQTKTSQVTCTDSMDSTDVDMSSEGTSRKDSVTHDLASEQDPVSAVAGVGLSTLYECTSHNCNILHICCWGSTSKPKKETKDSSKKTFHPFRVDHLNYHSISARPSDNNVSFEESRYHYMTKGQSVVENGLGQDHTPVSSYLTILEMLLSWQSIRPVVLKLLCQKNAFGETPFMTAVSTQNFLAALAILRFAVDNSFSTALSPNHQSSLYADSVLAQNREGMTPLQALFASFSSHYDVRSMRLFVSSIPVGYTAQQLLQLFKDCYPSVYRAEISRHIEEEESGDESGSSESAEEETQQIFVPLIGNVTRRQRTLRRGRRGRTGFSDSGLPLKGVVYFSNVHQLRAAHREMQDFRVLSQGNARGNFGQAHSVSFLNISLEGDETENDRDLDDSYPSMLSAAHHAITPPRRRSTLKSSKTGKQSGAAVCSVKTSALLKLASELLSCLLSQKEVTTSTDTYGETALCSLVHNPKCMQSLHELFSCSPRSSSSSSSLLSTANCSASQKLCHTMHNASSSAENGLIVPSLLINPLQLPNLPINQDLDIVSVDSSTAVDNPSGLFVTAGPPFSIAGITLPPNTSISRSSPLFSTCFLNGPHPMLPNQFSPTSFLTCPHPMLPNPPNINAMLAAAIEVAESAVAASIGNTVTNAFSGHPISVATSSPPVVLQFGGIPSITPLTEDTTPNESSSGATVGEVKVGRSPSQQEGAMATLESEDVSMSEAPPSHPTVETKGIPEPGPSSETNPDIKMLQALFTCWPSIVVTILGCYPDPTCPELTASSRLSSAQDLDNFVISLFLNCDKNLIQAFLSTIIGRINQALAQGESFHSVIMNGSLDAINESNLPLYVGRRFLNAVVRVLSLEHSRVKTSIVELSTPPHDGRGSSRLQQEVAGQGGSLLERLQNTLASFSWMAVETLAQTAEMASLPVRLGVAKPFGASSVTSEYQSARILPSMRYGGRNVNRNRSLAQQLHVRSALSNPDSQATNDSRPNPVLPHMGMKLVPQHRDNRPGTGEVGPENGETKKAGEGTGESGWYQYDGEFGMDMSDSDMAASEIGNDSFETNYQGGASFSRQDFYVPRVLSPAEEIFIDYTSSSDEDDPFADIINEPAGHHGNRDEEDGEGEIYPFAWALDGRRIGENTPVIRPTSPTSSFVFGTSGEVTTPLCTIPSIRFGAGFLARTFSRIVKDLVDLAQKLSESKNLKPCINLPASTVAELKVSTVTTLERTWGWVVMVLDVAEGQLQRGKMFDTQRYVSSLRGSARPSSSISSSVMHRIISRTASKSFIGSTPGEYITYLLRSQMQEDHESLPIIDLYGYEHVVYVLDGLIYTLNNWPKASSDDQSDSVLVTSSPTNQMAASNSQPDKMQSEEVSHQVGKGGDWKDGPGVRFFTRSESITCSNAKDEEEVLKSNSQFFGTPASPVSSGPLQEAFPLAKQPHLLKPYAKKEQLFRSPRPLLLEGSSNNGSSSSNWTGDDRGMEGIDGEEDRSSEPGTLPVAYSQLDNRTSEFPITLSWSVEKALQRWNTAIGVFAHIFLAEGPGSERANFLNARAGFASRMARFRHQVSQLFESTQSGRGEWASVSNTLSIRVRRDRILEDSFDMLCHLPRFHYSQIRVKFEGEDGSGPGVNRGYFAAFANALKNNEIKAPPYNKLGALFHQPGKEPEQSGLFSPQPFIFPSGSKSSALKNQRMASFRAIGRFLGLCFWFKHTVPFMVCRHVAKFLIGRELAWHDLAFYNADLYDGLRRMMIDADSGKKSREEFLSTYCCYFEAPIAGQKFSSEPIFVDLIPGGSKIPVTPERVQEYVRLYAVFVMAGCVKDELQAMREGLLNIIPPELLSGLTAEDFQLLLSGDSASISIRRLKSIIRFNHTHGRPSHICDRFEKMLWRVVGHMNNTQRQQLLYFATGSAALPATSDNDMSVFITIDVIGSSNTNALPVASTCSQRMSIPLYPSYHTLKKKLMQAIQCQAYGLG